MLQLAIGPAIGIVELKLSADVDAVDLHALVVVRDGFSLLRVGADALLERGVVELAVKCQDAPLDQPPCWTASP